MKRQEWRRAAARAWLVAALGFFGCSKEEPGGAGPLEKAGRELDETAQKVGEAISDGAITAQVKGALALNKNIDAMQVNVDTADGVVTLRGTVATEEARQDAERLARDVRGVKQVVNHLGIEP